MNTESGYRPKDRLRHLQEQLTGVFAEDTWPMKTIKTDKGEEQCHLHFDFTSPSLKIEFKYAVWFLFESRTWKSERDQRQLRFHLNCLSQWLNQVAPTASSLLERNLDYWEWSLRSYLVETNQLSQSRRKNLRASQEYVEYAFEDRRLGIFDLYAGDLWHIWQLQAGGAWGNWTSLGSPKFIVLVGDYPAMGVNGDGRLEVFAVGSDHALWHTWQVVPGGAWGN